MDLQYFLALNLMSLSALIILVALVNRSQGAWSWIAANAIVVAVGLAAVTFAREWSGAIVSAVFVPLILAPGVLSMLAQRRQSAGRPAEAARYARLAALLHPSRRAKFSAAMTSALAQPSLTEKLDGLAELAKHGTAEEAELAGAVALAEQGRWADVAALAIRSPHRGALMLMEIRALGETGRHEEMVRLAHAARASLSGHEQAMAELFVLAFTGRPAALALLLARPLGYLDTESKDYWQAVADLSVPDRAAAGRAALARLKSATRSDRLRNSVDRHLVGEPRARLSAEARNVVNEIEHRVIHASEAGLGTLARVPVTIALLAANLLVFGLEVLYGGSEDLDVLVELGAMWPPLVTEAGEWWRLASSVFLHYGPVHLGANMFMLLILGRMVEPAYGWLRFLAIYLAGGIGAAGLVLALMVVGGVSEGILIGASGAIFALFGAEVARQLAAWRRSRDALDRRQLVNLGLIMLVQVVIDLSVPEISGAAHLAGAAIGLALGLALGAGTALRGVREA